MATGAEIGLGAPLEGAVLVAWYVGFAALALSAFVALVVLAMRQRLLAQERRRARAFAAWRPVLFEAAIGGEPAVPALDRGDEDAFLLLWNQLQDEVRGESRARLAGLGERVGARRMAQSRLRRRDAFSRLLALRTIGHLGRRSDYADVARHLDDARRYLCVAAARALVHLDPRRAPRDILRRLAARPDWPLVLFATALAEANRARVAEAIAEIGPRLDADQLATLHAAVWDPSARAGAEHALAEGVA
jgi:hypothetical protein